MIEDTELIQEFTSEMIDAIAQLWMNSSICLIDVRQKQFSSKQPLLNYKLPSSMIVFAYGDLAQIQLNHTLINMESFGIFHGGKGTELSIHPVEDKLTTFMVMYKAERRFSLNREMNLLLEKVNPFVHLYGYVPGNPMWFLDTCRQMQDRWLLGTPLGRLETKSLLYQMIVKIYKELYEKKIRFLQPDPVASTKRYLDENYMKPVSFQDIADMFLISRGQLTRLFKRSEGKSLQEYLTIKRLEAAKEQLLQTRATVREIAQGCGMVEELNLIRAFKRYCKMTPSQYRNKMIASMHVRDIDNDYQYPYNEKKLASLVESQRGGELTMFGQRRSKEMILVAVVSLMVLLSACGTNASVNSAGELSQNTAQSQSDSNGGAATEEASTTTRVVTTIYGDVEIPVDPQRIGVWVYEQELHSLGIIPVSISAGSYESIWPEAEVFSYAPDKESLMSLDPDLIITYDDENFYNEYKDIAPVISIPLSTSSEEALRMIGDLLNVEDKAEELIAQFNEQADAVQKLLEDSGALGKTAVLIEPLADDIWFYDNAYGRGGNVLYDYLGFVIPDVVREQMGDKHFMNVSFEVLAKYCDADYIVVVTGEGYDALKEKEVWKSIPAVQNNKVIEFDGTKLSGRGLDTETLSYFTESFTALK